MQFQIIIAGVIVGLVAVYFILRRKSGHSEVNLPAVSEDVNLPVVSQPESPAPAPMSPVQETPPAINELDNQGSQQ